MSLRDTLRHENNYFLSTAKNLALKARAFCAITVRLP
jgi:hypothetical protein